MRLLVMVTALLAGHLALAATPLSVNPDFSKQQNQPWLIMIAQAGCHFCERLESVILQPLRASDAYTGRVQFAHVGIDRAVEQQPRRSDADGRSPASGLRPWHCPRSLLRIELHPS